MIDDINSSVIAGKTTQEEQRPNYNAWVLRVRAFLRLVGEDNFPDDIKLALNDTEQGIGLQQTTWRKKPDAALFEA